MLLLAFLAAAAQPAEPQARPELQARATVRIARPASLRVGATHTLEGVPLRETKLMESDGKIVQAYLAEFE